MQIGIALTAKERTESMNPRNDADRRNAICKECDRRKISAGAFDVHFDWRDCPYDCPNNLSLEKDGERDERTE